MAEEEKSAEAQLSDATWQWATRIAIAAALVGSGYFGAYLSYGDAPELRQQIKESEDRIVFLENQRETTNTRLAKENRDREVCQRDLKECRSR